MATQRIIEIRNLSFQYPKEGKGTSGAMLFEDLSLEVERGSFTCLMGPSGCGKSTLLRLIGGLLKPSSGSIHFHARKDPAHLPVGFMFQDARLLPWRRTLGNVLFGLEALPIDSQKAHERALESLRLVQLEPYARRFPRQLSGGQRSRVALARALAVNPELLLLDEPFGALDSQTRQELHEELLQIWRKTGKTIVFVTHDTAEAKFLAQKIYRLAGHPVRLQEA